MKNRGIHHCALPNLEISVAELKHQMHIAALAIHIDELQCGEAIQVSDVASTSSRLACLISLRNLISRSAVRFNPASP